SGWLALCSAALLALGAGRAAAQPANDFFTNALTIAGFSGSVTGSTVGATLEMGEPIVIDSRGGVPIPDGASVWFRWTAPASGTVFFNTFGSQFDTVLAAYDGTNLATVLQLAGNDDFLFLQSQISWPAQGGTEYRVKLSGFAGISGI